MPKITREALTRRAVETAKPRGRLYRLRDAAVPGLALRVTPAGSRTWAVTWGRGQERIIGDFPVMTLDAARDAAKRELAEVAQHGAPLATISGKKSKASNLGDFIRNDYGPWVEAERRSGKMTAERILAAFANLLNVPLADLSIAQLDKWKAERLRAGRTPTTVNRDLAALKAALSKAVEWKAIDTAPAAAVKKSKVNDDRRVRYLSDKERERLEAALAERDAEMIAARNRTIAGNRAQHAGVEPIPADGFGDLLTPLVITALNTGCRRSELTGLQWADVDLTHKRQILVRAHTSKGAKTRDVPLNPVAVDVLKRWRKQCKGDRVFPIQSPKKAWLALMERAKIHDFRFHDCRHDFASRLVLAGVPLAVIRDLLGHASITMTERYAHLCKSAKTAAVAMLGGAK